MTGNTDTKIAEFEQGEARRVLVLGATGTIGRATTQALVQQGHTVVCLVRRMAGRSENSDSLVNGAEMRFGDVTDKQSVIDDGICGEHFDTVISCMTSRTGTKKDSWAIDYAAHINVLEAAEEASIKHFILLSAICVQKPTLAFQNAKLAFEDRLMKSGLRYSIVRATAFFKSLSGQVDRVRKGKSFLLFGDGTLTSCKPISDADLADYLVGCLTEQTRHNSILPIGGPGPAITPLEQGEYLFAKTGRKPKFTNVPVAFFSVIIGALSGLGVVIPALRDKAELARIGRYYATESMLVLNPETGEYDAAVTPSTGSDTLFDFYDQLLSSDDSVDRGDHAVF